MSVESVSFYFEMAVALLLVVALFAVPIGSVIWLIVMIVKFTSCPKDDAERRSRLKKLLIAAAVTAAVVIGAIIWLIVSFAVGIMYM
ncbi:MAG: hypothetical protein IJF18_05370 [Oscillospiraceae bacterium]|nr:hypothetical protein [Oscillospiraceae bacterium]